MRLESADWSLPAAWVTLEGVDDAAGTVYTPDRVRVWIESDGGGEDRLSWSIVARHHPQVTLDTVLVFDGGARLFVRGMTNAGNLDRSGWCRWSCQSVI